MARIEMQMKMNSNEAQLARAAMRKDALPIMYPRGTQVCKKKGKTKGWVEDVSDFSLKISFSDGKTIWDNYGNRNPC